MPRREDQMTERFVVHGDNVEALKAYRAGDKEAFKKMGAKRDELHDAGLPYWNTDHDDEMTQTADERTHNAVIGGWQFRRRKSGNKNDTPGT